MKQTIVPGQISNRVIQIIPPRERNRILGYCKMVEVRFGTVLFEPYEASKYVYFPLTGFIAVVAKMNRHQQLEIGVIGNEGMLSSALVFGFNDSPFGAIVQGSGMALRLTAIQLKRVAKESPKLQRILNHYLYFWMTALAQAAGCAHFHEIEPRLARWLLVIQDRAHADHFHLTHEFLADMLGVRRSGITIAAGTLQEKKLIRYTRGLIHIVDRKGLEEAACACYEAESENYLRLITHGK